MKGQLTEERGPKLETIVRRGRKSVEERSNRLEELKAEYVATDSVQPNKYNPNRQSDRDFELLMRSMREDGFTQPIVVHRQTRQIVDGEHRWRAAREIGLPEIPVVFVDMTEEQMRVSTLRHNRARGSEDVELGAGVLRDLRALGALDWAQESLMLDDDEMNRLLEDIPAAEGLAGEEFSKAWLPTKSGDGQEKVADDGKQALSFSVEAKAVEKKFEIKLAGAKSEAERVAIEFERRKETYRLVLHYRGPDAELIRSVLGAMPAQKVVELCRLEKAKLDGSAAAE